MISYDLKVYKNIKRKNEEEKERISNKKTFSVCQSFYFIWSFNMKIYVFSPLNADN